MCRATDVINEEDHGPKHEHSYAEGDLHRRLDKLDDRMKEVEIAIARGVKLPVWLGPALITLTVAAIGQFGTTAYWGGQISQKVDSVPDLRAKCEECERRVSSIREAMAEHGSRLREVERLASGGTDDRWRKSDDNRTMDDFRRYVDAQVKAMSDRVALQENRSSERDRWWQHLFSVGAMKGLSRQ